jgi:hypothetical protein
MRVQALAPLALLLRERLDAGALAGLGRVEMSDGVTVDPERMARIILADVDRIDRVEGWDWLTEGEEQSLHDDLLQLLTLSRRSLPAYRRIVDSQVAP